MREKVSEALNGFKTKASPLKDMSKSFDVGPRLEFSANEKRTKEIIQQQQLTAAKDCCSSTPTTPPPPPTFLFLSISKETRSTSSTISLSSHLPWV
ncbi:hypothetical protein L3X38_020609 [Prunus dulcis]|uniref:Uncharacterized protein n=1 Tax=Prunus dulcis TaxID=3755 RepID=A0AAD4ZCU7_PRUDU|nr:hypothetical protein L3X38_020609 [Prunus dulcis]